MSAKLSESIEMLPAQENNTTICGVMGFAIKPNEGKKNNAGVLPLSRWP